MLFNSYIFIFAFLPVAFAGYFLTARRSHTGAALWLGLASLVFYGYSGLQFLPVLLGSIIVNYHAGTVLSTAKLEARKRKLLLIAVLMFDLGMLAYFKYFNFFVDSINYLSDVFNLSLYIPTRVLLPLGISFFTFTQIAFIADCYLGKVNERSFIHYLLFVSFFPHLIVGPIIHHKQMMPQFANPDIYRPNPDKIGVGLSIFIIGLSKKLLLADPLGHYSALFYSGVAHGVEPPLLSSWLGSLAYTFQVYFDFSGYSDMAVGLALLFGILLPFNFKSPYKATSIIDFWQRWHITLTSYIWEYIYTPLTVRYVRKSFGRPPLAEFYYTSLLPTFIAFMIIGLWHGANWTYLCFGVMHTIYITVNRLWRTWARRRREAALVRIISRRAVCWLLTFLCINASIVMFRADSVGSALSILAGMAGMHGMLPASGLWQSIGFNRGRFDLWYFILLAASFMIVLMLPNTFQLTPHFTKSETSRTILLERKWVAVGLGILFAISMLNIHKTSPFLYFQF